MICLKVQAMIGPGVRKCNAFAIPAVWTEVLEVVLITALRIRCMPTKTGRSSYVYLEEKNQHVGHSASPDGFIAVEDCQSPHLVGAF